jgi:prepilin-type N-terminal cleavage/methylation domain-containing protein
MSEDGYTLVEMLVALAMVSFAISGLSLGVQVLTKWQTATNDLATNVKDMRRAQSSFERLVEGWGPFRSDHPETLTGDPTGFRFACGQASPCAAGLDDRGGKLVLTLDDGHGGLQALPLDRAGPAEPKATRWSSPSTSTVVSKGSANSRLRT